MFVLTLLGVTGQATPGERYHHYPSEVPSECLEFCMWNAIELMLKKPLASFLLGCLFLWIGTIKRVGQGDGLYKTLLIEINMQRLSVGFQNEIARRVWVVGPVSVGHS